MALGSALRSITLPGAYPTLGVDGGLIYVGSGVSGSPWTLWTFDPQLNLLATETGGTNPAGAPQLLAPGRLVYREQDWQANRVFERQADGSWKQTGTAMPGLWQARDGHSMSVLAGRIEYDGWQVDPFNGANGAARIAGDWLVVQDHTNTRLARRAPDGTWSFHDVGDGVFSSMVLSDGTVLAQLAGGLLMWPVTGSARRADVAGWTAEGCGDTDAVDIATAHYDARTSRFFVFLRPGGQTACVTLERLHQESWARMRRLPADPNLAVLVTWAPPPFGAGIVIDLVDLTQPMFVPEAPALVAPPPGDPPPDPEPQTRTPEPRQKPELLISPIEGHAPLRVQATAHHFAHGPYEWRVRKRGERSWRVKAQTDVPEYFYTFPAEGAFEVIARADRGGRRTTNVRHVTVTSPPPVPTPPQPEPPRESEAERRARVVAELLRRIKG